MLIALYMLSLLVVIGGKAVTHMTLLSVYLFFWFSMICLCTVYFFENCRLKNYLIYEIVLLVLLSKSYGITYGFARNEIVKENGYYMILGGWDSASEVAVASNGKVTGFCWSYETPKEIFRVKAEQMGAE